MKRVICVTPLAKKIPVLENTDYIGVDAGALKLIEANLPIQIAVGDFDSMEPEDLEMLKKICPIEKHPVMKNETDSELAVRTAYEMGYDKVILFGCVAGRIDHTLLNIRLLSVRFPDLILQDETQRVTMLHKGSYTISNAYKNISFLPMEESVLTLEGFLYPLDKRKVLFNETYTTSNSLVKEEGHVIVHSGSFLCLQTNEE